jgi:hypothetical protein
MMTWRQCCCAGGRAPAFALLSPALPPHHLCPLHGITPLSLRCPYAPLLSPCFPTFLGVFRWPGEPVACPLIAHFVSIALPRLTPPTLPCLALPSCSLWLVQVAWGTCCLSTPHLHDTFVLPSFHLHFTSFHLIPPSFHLLSPAYCLHFTIISPQLIPFTLFHLIAPHYMSFHLISPSFYLIPPPFTLLSPPCTLLHLISPSFHLHYTSRLFIPPHCTTVQFTSPHFTSPTLSCFPDVLCYLQLAR